MSLSSIFSVARRLAPIAAEVILTLLAMGALPGLAEARPAVDRPGIAYGGETAAKWPMLVQVSRDRRQVVLIHASYEARCSNGENWFADESYTRLPVSARGAFRSTYDTGFDPDGRGGTERWEGSIAGRVDPGRARISGTMRVAVTLRSAGGAEKRCDTGKVSFTLRD